MVFCRSWNLANFSLCNQNKANTAPFFQLQIDRAFIYIVSVSLGNGGTSACTTLTPNGEFQHDVVWKEKPGFLAQILSQVQDNVLLNSSETRQTEPKSYGIRVVPM